MSRDVTIFVSLIIYFTLCPLLLEGIFGTTFFFVGYNTSLLNEKDVTAVGWHHFWRVLQIGREAGWEYLGR